MITTILSNDLAYAIAWTLLHSLWQISLVCIVLAFILKASNKASSTNRYLIALGAMASVILMTLITFTSYYMHDPSTEQSIIDVVAGTTVYAIENLSAESGSLLSSIESYIPMIVNLWIIGVSIFLIKILGGFVYIKKLISDSKLENQILGNTVDKLNKAFSINRKIQIKESIKINTPMVMGYLKPVILFPLGLVNQLSTSEVEAILAHEMAHIKRHDYIFNLLQMLVESIFYYHPGIWYISSRINAERENCCDDMAIAFTASNVSYAKTLVKLQDLKRLGNYSPALSFSGNKQIFTQRIMRLLNQRTNANQYRDKFIALVLIFASLVVAANNFDTNNTTEAEGANIYFIDDCPSDEQDILQYLDTIPEKNNFHIKKITDEKEIEMEMENGEVVKLVVDGEEVEKEEYDKHINVIKELSPEKGKDLITIFPECDDDTGFVYMLNGKNGVQIKLDSILGEIELKELEGLRSYFIKDEIFRELEDENLFRYEVIHEMIADSLKDHLKEIEEETAYIVKRSIEMDSVWDLLPERLPNINIWRDNESELEDIIIDINDNVIIDLKNHEEATIMALKQSKKAMEKAQKEYEKAMKRSEKDKLKNSYRYYFNHNLPKPPSPPKIYEYTVPKNNFYFETRSNRVSDHLHKHLAKDQLIDPSETTKIELTHKFLKINGDKQPKNIWKKYKKLYEEFTGLELTKGSKLKFELEASINNHSREHFFRMNI